MIALAVACADVRAQSALSVDASSRPMVFVVRSWVDRSSGHRPSPWSATTRTFRKLTPGAGWEGALGFDYRLAGCGAPSATFLVKTVRACWLSPYHISGQFRYGQNGGGSAHSAALAFP